MSQYYMQSNQLLTVMMCPHQSVQSHNQLANLQAHKPHFFFLINLSKKKQKDLSEYQKLKISDRILIGQNLPNCLYYHYEQMSPICLQVTVTEAISTSYLYSKLNSFQLALLTKCRKEHSRYVLSSAYHLAWLPQQTLVPETNQ